MVDENLEVRAGQVADECAHYAAIISDKAEKHRRLNKYLQALNILVALFAAIIALIPAANELAGEYGLKAVAVIAAITLFLDVIIPRVFHIESPELLTAYAHYVRGYTSKIKDTLADNSLNKSNKAAKVHAWLELANKNIDDVVTKWPWCNK